MKVGDLVAVLKVDFAGWDKDARRAEGMAQRLGNNLSGILKNAFSFTLGMGFFEAVKQGFRSTVGTMFSFNAQMEQAQIGFSTMLGSAQRAKRFLDDVAAFAAKTPFEFPDLLDASKRMLAYGFAAEDVLPTMEAVGNATAAVGLGAQGIDRIILALGQMRAKGKVSGEEMRQLTETGIPAWEFLAEAMGKSTAEVMKLSERGLIPADQAIKMLVEGMNKRFPSMMSQMENTWDGVTSTIRDVWQMTIGAMTKGLFRGVVSWLQRVRDVATGFYEAFRAGGLQYAIEQTFGAGVAASVSTLTSALKGLWGIVVGVGRTIVRYWSTIGPLTAWVVKGFLAFKTAGFVVRMAAAAVKTFTAASLAMRGSLVATSPSFLKLISDIVLYYKCLIPATVGTFGFSTALTYLKAALMAVQTALGAVIWPLLLIGVVLMGGISLWTKYQQAVQAAAQKAQMDKMAQQQKEYMDAVNKAAQGTGNQADALGELGKAATKNLQSFDEVHTIMEETAAATLGAPALDAPIVSPIPEMELPEMDFAFDMDAAIAGAKAEMGGFWGWLKAEAAEAWNSVKTLGANLWEGVKGGWEGFKTYAGGFWDNLKLYAGQAWNTIKTDASGLWEGVKGTWGTFKEWAGGLWNGVKEKWGGFKTWTRQTWDGISTTLGEKWQGIKTKASETWEQVKTGAGIAWQNIKTAAASGWDGIKTTVSTRWNSLKTGASTVWSNIKSTISEKWNALQTDAPPAWENIKTAISSRFDQAKDSVLAAAGTLYDRVPKSWSDMRDAVENLRGKVVGSIAGPFDLAKQTVLGIVDAAKNWGKNLIANIVDGIQAKFNAVKNAVKNVANTIKGWLGFGSPTDEGPGRYADRWAPNLMRMYAKGILANISMVQSAASQVARSLMPMTAVPSPVFAGMGDVGRLGMGRGGGLADELAAAIRGVGGATNRPIEVTVNIDSREMARVLIPAIQSEQDRIGAVTIVRAK